MKEVGKILAGIIIVILTIAVMTVLNAKTGRLTGGTGLFGWIIVGLIITYAYTLISSAYKSVSKSVSKPISDKLYDIGYETGKTYGKFTSEREKKKQIDKQIYDLENKIKNIDVMIESYKKMDETGAMSETERNDWKELTKERLKLSERLQDCGI